MIDIAQLRRAQLGVLSLGNHVPILQSMFDFDYLSGQPAPRVRGIVTASGRHQKLFWGAGEVLVPCFADVATAADSLGQAVNLAFNATSGRRAAAVTAEFFDHFPAAYGANILAEGTPEQAALALYHRYQSRRFTIGPSSVGLLLPGRLKLGAIGGTDYYQMLQSRIFTPGTLAVLSASGGMTGELIRLLAAQGQR
ncbi:MAG TPA: hypothetical protein VK963_00915, partial [Candidatus Saccharimonadales bacterium]|nr:hypothetical protein [Candidatus Saccharimonadales bacterium]